MTVPEKLVVARGETPRAAVADAVGVTVSAIAMYELGKRMPRDEIKVKLADYYDWSVQDLFFDQNCHEK